MKEQINNVFDLELQDTYDLNATQNIEKH